MIDVQPWSTDHQPVGFIASCLVEGDMPHSSFTTSRLADNPELAAKTTPPTSTKYRSREALVDRPLAESACTCEQNELALLLYRSVEFGFDLSPNVMAWLPRAVARIEAACPAALHYGSVLLDEQLAVDPTVQGEEPWEFAQWMDALDDDAQLYAHRTEDGGRFIEAETGGLAIDRDAEDYTSRIRSHEMGKLAALKAEMRKQGLSWEEQLPWVERAIGFKRADAIRDHAAAVAKAERAGRTDVYVAAPEVVSESQIRLRAYSYCLAYLQKGQKDAPTAPDMVTFLTPEKQRVVDAAARIAAGYADDAVDEEAAARDAWLAQF